MLLTRFYRNPGAAVRVRLRTIQRSQTADTPHPREPQQQGQQQGQLHGQQQGQQEQQQQQQQQQQEQGKPLRPAASPPAAQGPAAAHQQPQQALLRLRRPPQRRVDAP
jgi:hypothetical protein